MTSALGRESLLLAPATALLLCAAAPAGEPSAGLNPRMVAMDDNTWLNLKPTRTPKSRAYSGACFGAGRLFYFGGGHFSYTYNDVELYNPATNTWTQVTKPERPATGKGHSDWGKVAEEKASPTGAPYVTHTYQYTSWDPIRKRFFLPFRRSGVWEFDPATAKWENILSVFKDPRPKTPHDLGFGLMAGIHSTFVPGLGKPALVVTHQHRGIYVFDYENAAWEKHRPLPEPLTGAELYSTYVDEWKAHLVASQKWRGKRAEFFKVDLAAGTAEAVECPAGIERCHALSYDSANNVVICMVGVPAGDRAKTVSPWAVDVKTMKWTQMKPEGPAPAGQLTGLWAPLWYDRAHNVHLFLNVVSRGARYEGGVTETWAYRYRRLAAK